MASPTDCSARSDPRIEVDCPDAGIDVPLRIVLAGFAADRLVTVTATWPFLNGTTWQSCARFVTDASGRVDISTSAPESGSYSEVSAMGLFWSMTQHCGEPAPVAADSILQPRRITLQACAPDGARAETVITRWLARPGVTRHVVREAGIVGTLFLPPGGKPREAVLVLPGSGGGVPESTAAVLASRGYAALALAYYRMPGLPQALVEIPLEYFERAIAWMRAQDWLGDGFLAALGASRGGELALLLAATFSGIDAVIAYAPSGVLDSGFDPAEPDDAPPRAAWTHRGVPLPYMQQDNRCGDVVALAWQGEDIVVTPLYESWLRDPDAVERATIAVERIAGPVLLISGKDDRMWPAYRLAEIARARLVKHRHPHAVVHLAYADVGHSVCVVPYLPMTTSTAIRHAANGRRYVLGGTVRCNAQASADAWAQVLAFLEQSTSQAS